MTTILAKIFGFYFLAIGIAFLTHPLRFKKMYQKIIKDENILLFCGIMALLIGAFVVSVHNEWVLGWPIIITLLGWWSLIKGFGLLIYPDFTKFFLPIMNKSKSFYQFIGTLWLLFGLFLAFEGWR